MPGAGLLMFDEGKQISWAGQGSWIGGRLKDSKKDNGGQSKPTNQQLKPMSRTAKMYKMGSEGVNHRGKFDEVREQRKQARNGLARETWGEHKKVRYTPVLKTGSRVAMWDQGKAG